VIPRGRQATAPGLCVVVLDGLGLLDSLGVFGGLGVIGPEGAVRAEVLAVHQVRVARRRGRDGAWATLTMTTNS